AVVWAYGFAVMAATDVDTLPRQVAAALMLGFGSLHWTILQFAAVAAVAWVLWTWALPLLVLFGVGIPASAAGLATRIIFRQLQEGSAGSAPDRPRTRDRDEALPHPRGITSGGHTAGAAQAAPQWPPPRSCSPAAADPRADPAARASATASRG